MFINLYNINLKYIINTFFVDKSDIKLIIELYKFLFIFL